MRDFFGKILGLQRSFSSSIAGPRIFIACSIANLACLALESPKGSLLHGLVLFALALLLALAIALPISLARFCLRNDLALKPMVSWLSGEKSAPIAPLPWLSSAVLATAVGLWVSYALGFQSSFQRIDLAQLVIVFATIIVAWLAFAIYQQSLRFRANRSFRIPTPLFWYALLLVVWVVKEAVLETHLVLRYANGIGAINVGILWLCIYPPIARAIEIASKTNSKSLRFVACILASVALAFFASLAPPRSWFGLRGILAEDFAIGKPLLRILSRPFDRDHDGYGQFFAGGDCNDHNPSIHPWADDLENNHSADCIAGTSTSPTPAEVPHASCLHLDRPSILLITVDALRRDAVYPYNERANTPVLRELASKSVVFDRAISPAGATILSTSSILRGYYPGALRYEIGTFWPDVVSLHPSVAELLRRDHYRTGALLETSFLRDKLGLLSGFDVTISTEGDVKPMLDERLRVRAQFDREFFHPGIPFFAWVHILDPHTPYFGMGTPREAYAHDVESADTQIGLLLELFRAHTRQDSLVVIVTADHGESLTDHSVVGHGRSMHAAETRVPLFISIPGVAPRRVALPVSTIDIAPTILQLTNHTLPSFPDARSLLPDACGETRPPRPVMSAAYALSVAMQVDLGRIDDGDFALLFDPASGNRSLYNVRNDPDEEQPLASAETDRLLNLLLQMRGSQRRQ